MDGEETFFYQTAETGERNPNSSVKGSDAPALEFCSLIMPGIIALDITMITFLVMLAHIHFFVFLFILTLSARGSTF